MLDGQTSPSGESDVQPLDWRREWSEDALSVRGVTFFRYARHGLLHGLRLMGSQPGDNILFPEYICREATDPVAHSGYEARYYRIRRDFTADLEHVKSLIDDHTRAILTVHYFGFPQPLRDLQRVCDAHEKYLIEDNAHGFLSSHRGRPLGFTGDIGIFSIRKTIPLPDGAALVVNSPGLRARDSHRPKTVRLPRVLPYFWRLESAIRAVGPRFPAGTRLMQSADDVAGAIQRKRKPALTVTSERGEVADGGLEKPISPRSWFRLWQTDFAYVIRRRRENYRLLLEWLDDASECGLVMPRLEAGVCPYVFPILVDNGDQAISDLRARGIKANYWPDLPAEVAINPQKYPMANSLRARLVTLPISQDIGIAQRDESSIADGGLYERLQCAYSLT